MRESLFLLLVLAVVHAHSHTQAFASAPKEKSGKKLKLTPPGQTTQTTEDPGSATQLLFKDPHTHPLSLPDDENKKAKISLTATCTDSMGMIYKKDDIGYTACLRNQNKASPTDRPGDHRKNNSVGISIGQ